MFTRERALELVGAIAYDRSDQHVGSVTSVCFDQATGEPQLVKVETWLPGRMDTLAPLALARVFGSGRITFATGAEVIVGAPMIPHDREPSDAEIEQVFRHYGLRYPQRRFCDGLTQASSMLGHVPLQTGGTAVAPRSPMSVEDAISREIEELASREIRYKQRGKTDAAVGAQEKNLPA